MRDGGAARAETGFSGAILAPPKSGVSGRSLQLGRGRRVHKLNPTSAVAHFSAARREPRKVPPKRRRRRQNIRHHPARRRAGASTGHRTRKGRHRRKWPKVRAVRCPAGFLGGAHVALPCEGSLLRMSCRTERVIAEQPMAMPIVARAAVALARRPSAVRAGVLAIFRLKLIQLWRRRSDALHVARRLFAVERGPFILNLFEAITGDQQAGVRVRCRCTGPHIIQRISKWSGFAHVRASPTRSRRRAAIIASSSP